MKKKIKRSPTSVILLEFREKTWKNQDEKAIYLQIAGHYVTFVAFLPQQVNRLLTWSKLLPILGLPNNSNEQKNPSHFNDPALNKPELRYFEILDCISIS